MVEGPKGADGARGGFGRFRAVRVVQRSFGWWWSMGERCRQGMTAARVRSMARARASVSQVRDAEVIACRLVPRYRASLRHMAVIAWSACWPLNDVPVDLCDGQGIVESDGRRRQRVQSTSQQTGEWYRENTVASRRCQRGGNTGENSVWLLRDFGSDEVKYVLCRNNRQIPELFQTGDRTLSRQSQRVSGPGSHHSEMVNVDMDALASYHCSLREPVTVNAPSLAGSRHPNPVARKVLASPVPTHRLVDRPCPFSRVFASVR